MLFDPSKRLPLVLFVATALFSAIGQLAQGDIVHDAAADFSIASNPNGPWTYGTVDTPGGSFTALNSTSTSFLNSNFDSWLLNNTFPSISLNTSGTNQQAGGMNLDAGTLGLHPGAGIAQTIVVRWTAPLTETLDLDVVFQGRDSLGRATTDLFVVHNDSIISSGSIESAFGEGSGLSYSNRMQFNAGDTIDFIVNNGGDGHFGDSTGLAATFSSVPEPSSCIALLASAFCILVRRKKG